MPPEPTLEQEIEQAVEESVQEDTSKESEEVDDTSAKTESFQSEGSTEEVLVPADEETKEEAPGDTQKESEADTQVGDTQGEAGGDTKEPEIVEISPETLASAVSSGLTLDQARSFKSEEALNQFNVRVNYERSQAAEHQQAQQQTQQQQREYVDPFADLPKLDPESYDPEVVEMFERLTGIARDQQEQIAVFQGQQEQAAAQAQQAGQQEVERWFDSETTGLGDNFKEQLGEGSYRSLQVGSPQAANRDAIADQMSIMIAGYRHHGMSEPPREEIFQSAARAVLSERYSEIANEEFTSNLQNQKQATTSQRVSRARVKRNFTPEEEDEKLGALLDETFS